MLGLLYKSTTYAISCRTQEAYSKDRSAAVATTAAPQDVLRAALALAVPPLQSSLFTSNGPITWAEQAIVFPALQAARMDVLRAASAGDTLAEVQAAVPTAASLDVTRSLLSGLSRQLWASALLPSSAVFWPRLRSAARPLRPGRPTQFWIGLRRWQRWQSLVRPAT